MPQQVVATGAQPCVWMCAGLVSYRLCSRDFDCEHCPLDAALRGEFTAPAHSFAPLYRRAGEDNAPADRLYTTGHTWVQRLEAGAGWRIGVDAFAAALIANVTNVTCDGFEHLQRGDPLCDIDLGLGVLRIGAPIAGRVLRHNEELAYRPNRVVTDPYGDGWLAELSADDPPTSLMTSHGARHQLELDLRQFRRAVAFRLLAFVTSTEVHNQEEEVIRDLRSILVRDNYADCIREFIH